MPTFATARPGARTWPYWLVAALAWFGSLGLRPLFNPDEGRYAEIPREMLLRGDFVLPRLNDLVYLEKPPLQYWLTALGYRLFGVHAYSARLVAALAAAAGVAAVHAAARRLWDPERADLAAWMATSMLFYVFMGELLTLDMLLAVLLLCAVLCFCLGQQVRARDAAATRRWLLACWALMAAATLTKGLIGLVIPGGILLAYTLLARDWAVWRHLELLRGGALYVLLVVPWFALVEHAHRGALWFLIVHEHFQRYLTTVHARYQPAWYFLPILAAGVLPWLPQAVRALATGWRAGAPRGTFDVQRLLWVAAVLIVAFYSVSDSKLAPYILPVMPLLALAGSGGGERAARDLKLSACLSLLIALALGAALIAYPRLAPGSRNLTLVRSAGPWLALAATLMAAGALAALTARGDWRVAARRLALGHYAAALVLATLGAASLAWKYSGVVVLPQLQSGLAADPAAPVYAFRTYDWTLPVYTGRLLVPVEWRGELDYGLNVEPAKGIAELAEFERRWRADPQAFAIIEPGSYAAFTATGLPFRELAMTSELILVSRH